MTHSYEGLSSCKNRDIAARRFRIITHVYIKLRIQALFNNTNGNCHLG